MFAQITGIVMINLGHGVELWKANITIEGYVGPGYELIKDVFEAGFNL